MIPVPLLVAAPSTLATDALRRAFKQRRRQFSVVGSAHTCRELLKQVAEQRPRVVVISANLQDDPWGGLRALRELRRTRSSTRAILLLNSSKREQVIEAFSHGAKGVLCKNDGFEALCKCIRCVDGGQVWADSSQLQWVVEALGEREPVHIVSPTGAPLLTKRQDQIVRMLAEGMPSAEICSKLRLSPHTVKNHLFHIYDKLGISNRAELLLYALSSRDGFARQDVLAEQSAA